MRVVIGLGSNLGDRKRNLDLAIKKFTFLEDLKISQIIENQALLPEGAPKDWDMPYCNMAVSGDTNHSLPELLVRLKEIESDLGREIGAARWAPRIIDLDILIADKDYASDDLQVPHKELFKRDFALRPAQELEPQMVESYQNRLAA